MEIFTTAVKIRNLTHRGERENGVSPQNGLELSIIFSLPFRGILVKDVGNLLENRDAYLEVPLTISRFTER